MKNFLATTGGCILMLAVFGFGLLQLGAGSAGIENEWGWGWGLAAIISAIWLRFTIPIVVGCYLCAHEIWGWNWFFSAIFAAPGLIFMIPALLNDMISAARRRF
jgi:hypothetical protein